MTIYEVIAQHYDANLVDMNSVPLYLGAIPQGAPVPAVTFFSVNLKADVTHDGDGKSQMRRVQFTSVAEYLTDADTIRSNLRKLLKTLPGTYDNIWVQSCVPTGLAPDMRDDVNLRWNALIDYWIYYTDNGGD